MEQRRDGIPVALVVESRPWLDVTLHEGLEAAGFRVIGATTPEGAAVLVDANEAIDALVTELTWPDLRALEIAGQLSARGTSVVVNTVSNRAALAARQAGFEALLEFDPNAVVALVLEARALVGSIEPTERSARKPF